MCEEVKSLIELTPSFDPALPDWLPDVTFTDLRLGRRRFDIRFWRDGDETRWKVLKGDHEAVTTQLR
jgi:hypothetical protein